MLVGNISEDHEEDNTRSLQQETLLNEFPASTNILVVDTNLTTLLNMKKIIVGQYAYQVKIETDAERALAFLTSCKHEINIVIWDFHMPGINGLQALEVIGSNLDLPVVIMSDDNQTESVMQATIHGACDYVMKPVKEEVLANIWQHVVRKRMNSKPKIIPPVQSDLAQSHGLDHENNSDNFKMINQDNDEQNVEKKVRKKARKPRMTWTMDLHQKFLEAIDIGGGIEKANPRLILKYMQDLKVEGLTRNNVASHLQKHRINLQETQTPQQTQEIGWYNTYRPAPPLQGSGNVHTAISSYLTNGRAVNPIQQNQNRNGYLTMSNNQCMTNPLPRLPYFDHHIDQHQQQQHQSSHQFNYFMSKQEFDQASTIYATDLEPTYPTLPYDPNEFLIEGYNFNQ